MTTMFIFAVVPMAVWVCASADLAGDYDVTSSALMGATARAHGMLCAGVETCPAATFCEGDCALLQFLFAKIPELFLLDQEVDSKTLLRKVWGIEGIQDLSDPQVCSDLECLRRLKSLVIGDLVGKGKSVSEHGCEPFDVAFANFANRSLYYHQNGGWLFWLDHPGMKGKDVTKMKIAFCQTHGVSGWIAASVFQHYIHLLRTSSVETADYAVTKVAENIRMQAFQDVKQHIMVHAKTSSVHVAKSLCHISDNALDVLSLAMERWMLRSNRTNYGYIEADLYQLLTNLGPGLVSGFRVDDGFEQKKVSHHSGRCQPTREPEPRLHSMVIVGTRTSANKQRLFLLQNSWAKKQFVEVSVEYLISAGGMIYFLEKGASCAPPDSRAAAIAEVINTASDGAGDELYPKDCGLC